jgi:hypothetical protein
LNTGTITYGISVGTGLIQASVSRSNESLLVCDIGSDKLNAGKAGSLTTRTDNDTGVVTAGAGHGIATSDKVDVHWAIDGVRYVRRGMTATVDGNNITVDAGAGSNLPAQDTAVVVAKQAVATETFDGDDLDMFMVKATKPASLDFVDAGGVSVGAILLNEGEPFVWVSNQGPARPITGNAVASIKITPGTTEATDVVIRGVRSSI